MPYSKQFKKPRRNKKQKPAKSKMGKLSQRITALSNRLPALESHVIDINSFATSVSTSASANYPMIQIAQGSTAANRKGDTVVLKNSTLNLAVTKGDANNVVRLILAATPSDTHLQLSDVLQYANTTSHSNLPFASPYKTQPTTSEQTYEILFDKVYNLTEEINMIVDKVKISYGKKGKRVNFNSASSSAPENYKLSLMYISDSSAGAHPNIHYSFRTRFVDV